jgi:hypothetical protein
MQASWHAAKLVVGTLLMCLAGTGVSVAYAEDDHHEKEHPAHEKDHAAPVHPGGAPHAAPVLPGGTAHAAPVLPGGTPHAAPVLPGGTPHPVHGAAAPHEFHGHDVHRFSREDREHWHDGSWRHEIHDGRLGWWWFVDYQWYVYPEPVYPYPLVVSEQVYVEPAPVVVQAPAPMAAPQQFWYYCDNPSGYYPYVQKCDGAFREVPITTSTTGPVPSGAPSGVPSGVVSSGPAPSGPVVKAPGKESKHAAAKTGKASPSVPPMAAVVEVAPPPPSAEQVAKSWELPK